MSSLCVIFMSSEVPRNLGIYSWLSLLKSLCSSGSSSLSVGKKRRLNAQRMATYIGQPNSYPQEPNFTTKLLFFMTSLLYAMTARKVGL